MDSKTPVDVMININGHAIPKDQVHEQDKLRNQVVMDLVKEALLLNNHLADFKRRSYNDVADFVSIVAEKFKIKVGGEKGNINLISYDGRYKVVLSIADRMSFTPELEAAKALMTQSIKERTQGGRHLVQGLVDRAFNINSDGQAKTATVLGLLRLDIDDEQWRHAMSCLKDAIQTNNTANYIRVYERIGNSGQYQAIPLDIAAVRV